MRILYFCTIVIGSVILAVLYGQVHNWYTFQLSPAFFQEDQFLHLGINEWGLSVKQQLVLYTFICTWWVGLIIGLLFGFSVFFIAKSDYWPTVSRAILLCFGCVLVGSFLGWVFGLWHIDPIKSNLAIPEKIIDKVAYIRVAYIHNMTYFGTLIGLLVGLNHIKSKLPMFNKALRDKY